MPTSAIEITDLWFSYNSRLVLREVDLRVAAGEMVSIVSALRKGASRARASRRESAAEARSRWGWPVKEAVELFWSWGKAVPKVRCSSRDAIEARAAWPMGACDSAAV